MRKQFAEYLHYEMAQEERLYLLTGDLGYGLWDRIKIDYPDRFINSYEANPNNGMDEVRKIRRLKQEFDIKAVTGFPSGLCPQVPVNDKKWYPIYAALIDLDIPLQVYPPQGAIP